jgi:hypothetical protein
MLVKLAIQLLLIQFLLAIGCASGHQKTSDNKQLPMIILNGDKLNLDENAITVFIQEVEKLLSGCDDFYEMIVTEQVIETIREDKQYIEIIFPEKRTLETSKFKLLEFDRILVPTTGKFHSSGQVTFFTGTKNFSNTPMLYSNGSKLLDEVLKKIAN